MGKNKFSKTIVAIIISLFLIVSIAILANNAYQEYNRINPPESFIKTGEVITLIQDNDRYFYRTENFNQDGTYSTPSTERQITYQEYAQLRANKGYDILINKEYKVVNGKYLEVSERFDKDENAFPSNYVAEIIDGNFEPIRFSEHKNKQVILIEDDKTFYVVTKFLNENGDYTSNATYQLVNEMTYRRHILDKNYDYEIVYEYFLEGNTLMKKTSFIDKVGDFIKRPIILEMTGFVNLEDYIKSQEPYPTEDPFEDPFEDFTPDPQKPDPSEQDSGSSSPGAPDSGSGDWWTGEDFSWEDSDDWFGEGSDASWNDSWWFDPNAGSDSEWNDSWWGIGDSSDSEWSDWWGTPSEPTDTEYGDWGFTPSEENKMGYIDDLGNFIPTDEFGNVLPSEDGEFDEYGNFHPKEEDGYFDSDGVWHPAGEEGIGGYYDEEGNFYPDGEDGYFDSEGVWHPAGEEGIGGYYDSEGNFYPDGEDGYFDKDGLWHDKAKEKDGYFDEEGRFILNKNKWNLMINRDGNIKVVNEDGYYDKTGLYYHIDGRKGYYDENARFVEANMNEYSGEEGFYDSFGNWHSFNYFYTDMLGSTQIIMPPTLGVTTDGLFIKIQSHEGVFDKNGLYINEDYEKGFFDINGRFIKSKVNPYKGGFFDQTGEWIHDSMYTIDSDGIIILNIGYFDKFGSYYTPAGDIGYFDENGKFVVSELNSNTEGFYDYDGNFHEFGQSYTDSEGNIHTTGQSNFYTETGKLVEAEYVRGVRDKNDNIITAKGIVITEDGTVGYYNHKGEFIKGKKIYRDGYYDASGYFFMYDGTVISPDGKIGYFDKDGVFHEGENPYTDGYYDSEGNFITKDGYIILPDGTVILPDGTKVQGYIDDKGNIVLPDGTVITPDGKVGYYDEDGNFVERIEADTYPEGTIILPDGTVILPDGTVILPDGTVLQGYVDEYGNIVLPDGTVITPDGRVGYYDEDGNFVQTGEAMELPEGTIILEDGTIILPDGTVIYPDGTIGHLELDEHGNWVLPDGTVITPDGRVGYYDEDGNFVQTGEAIVLDEKGFLLENGLIVTESGKIITTDATVLKAQATEDGYIILPDGTVITPDGRIGYFDEDGNFVETGRVTELPEGAIVLEDGTIVLPDGTIIYPDGTIGQAEFDEFGNMILPDGTVITPDGRIGYIDEHGNIVLSDGTVITPDGRIGYYDEDGNFIETGRIGEGFFDEEGRYYEVGLDGYYDTDGTFYGSDGRIGYYDEDGVFHEGTNPYISGFYDSQGDWIGEGEPQIGYYDEDGNWIIGDKIPYEDGYYDQHGNWHPFDQEDGYYGYYDKQGTLHKTGEDAIGYFDDEGNFHLYSEDGYYDDEGTYHHPDGTFGYYDKDGVFHEGEVNPYKDGFYDSEGNWHPFGEEGYFDPDGNYHDSVTDRTSGYYDKDGVFHEGTNPYIGGYYDSEGNWHPFDEDGYYAPDGTFYRSDGTFGYYDEDGNWIEGEKNPYLDGYYDSEGNFISFTEGQPVGYYDADGVYHEGISPYKDGFYDQHGNWHPFDEEGYYDQYGTFHRKDGIVGYYDKDGVFHEGTNPYLEGYYDQYGNWHPFDEDGYYAPDGTFYRSDGTFGYYDEDGNWIEGKKNPYKDGYYDQHGNWHPFDEDGYYTPDGTFVADRKIVEKYRYGSSEYILNPGHFSIANPKILRKGTNSLQFTVDKNALNPRYIDTGIYVGLNAMVEYEDLRDALHGIAVNTNNVFVKDNDYSMLIYEGRIVNLERNQNVNLKQISDMFMDTKLDVRIAKTRYGGQYHFVEAIETDQDINIEIDGKRIELEHPLLSRDNEVLISLKDVIELVDYRLEVKEGRDKTDIRLTRIKQKDDDENTVNRLSMVIGDKRFIEDKNGVKYKQFVTPPIIQKIKNSNEIYIPINLLPSLMNKGMYWDSIEYKLYFE